MCGGGSYIAERLGVLETTANRVRMTQDQRSMGETTRAAQSSEIDGPAGDGASAQGVSDRVAEPTSARAAGALGAHALPTTLDALGRELLALRVMTQALADMLDAALTNYRLLQMQHVDVVVERPTTALDRITALVTAEGPKRPRTFGDKLSPHRAPIDGADTSPAAGE